MMTTCTVRLGDRTVVARVNAAGDVEIDEAVFSVTRSGPGTFVVSDGTRRWPLAVADVGDERWVSVAGRVVAFDVESNQVRPPRKKSPRADATMAPMPATVMSILVEPGQSVDAGDTIMVLEAMKMELPIRAPRAGRVSAIHCAPGDLVQPGVTLVDLD